MKRKLGFGWVDSQLITNKVVSKKTILLMSLFFKISDAFHDYSSQDKCSSKNGAQRRVFSQYDHSDNDTINRLDTTDNTGGTHCEISKTINKQRVTCCCGDKSQYE